MDTAMDEEEEASTTWSCSKGTDVNCTWYDDDDDDGDAAKSVGRGRQMEPQKPA